MLVCPSNKSEVWQIMALGHAVAYHWSLASSNLAVIWSKISAELRKKAHSAQLQLKIMMMTTISAALMRAVLLCSILLLASCSSDERMLDGTSEEMVVFSLEIRMLIQFSVLQETILFAHMRKKSFITTLISSLRALDKDVSHMICII